MPSSFLASQFSTIELPQGEQGIANIDLDQQPDVLLRLAVELTQEYASSQV
jgi:gluconate kinase